MRIIQSSRYLHSVVVEEKILETVTVDSVDLTMAVSVQEGVLVAGRDLGAGDTVLQLPLIVRGPGQGGPPLCLGCLKSVSRVMYRNCGAVRHSCRQYDELTGGYPAPVYNLSHTISVQDLHPVPLSQVWLANLLGGLRQN